VLIIEAESEVRLWWPVLPDLVFFSVYIKARLRCLLAGILPGMLHGNLAPLNKAELGESAVHKRQIERAHNNVQQAEIQYVQFTFTQNMNEFMNDRSVNSFRHKTVDQQPVSNIIGYKKSTLERLSLSKSANNSIS